MNYLWAPATNVGLVRESNEDAVHPTDADSGPGPLLVGVADGMGGHVGGEIASHIALEAAVGADGDLADKVRAGNTAIVREVIRAPILAGMGTTLTMGLLEPDGTLSVGHVGDSRAYLFRDGSLRQLTTDHSLVAELLAAGKIRPEDVPTHPQRHLVTRALGLSQEVEVDTITEQLRQNDLVLFCSDGLTTLVADPRIAEILEQAEGPLDAAWSLVEAANLAGGVDNTSVVVVAVRP